MTKDERERRARLRRAVRKLRSLLDAPFGQWPRDAGAALASGRDYKRVIAGTLD